MRRESYRPIAVVLTSHWLSMLGTGLVTTAAVLWLFLITQDMQRRTSNPYAGILLFIVLPFIFFGGLLANPIGAYLSNRRIEASLSEPRHRQEAKRRLLTFLFITTVANVVIGAQLTYRSVEYMETESFCGQSCHVMAPEFRAHQVSPHSKVACVDCHVGPGAGGWLHAKMNGTRQLIEAVLNSSRAQSPRRSNRIVS